MLVVTALTFAELGVMHVPLPRRAH